MRSWIFLLAALGCTRSSDTEDTDTDVVEPVVRLVEGTPVVCSSPSAPGDLQVADLGPDWAAQGFGEESGDPLAAAGMTIIDLTGDGLLDIYLPQIGMDQIYVGQPDGSLVDESSSRLPSLLSSPSNTGTAADVDGDGDQDLFVARKGGDHVLLVNDGSGVFTDGTEAAGLDRQGWPVAGGSFGDMDGDGDLDLFSITFRTCDSSLAEIPENPYTDGTQALWENQGDGTFVDVSERMPDHPGGIAWFRAAVWVDIDEDGDQDLFVLSDRSTTSDCMVNNMLFVNEDGHFVDASQETGLGIRMEGMGLGMGDVNGDGVADFAMSDMQRLWLVVSDGVGAWYDVTATSGLTLVSSERDRWSGWGTELVDLDNDGDLDLHMGFGGLPDAPGGDMNPWEQPDALYLQEGGQFTEVSSEWGVDLTGSTRAVIPFDLDDDGWLDLGVREIAGPAVVLRSHCASASWLQLRLQDVGANRYGIGAQVTVRSEGQEQTRWLMAGGTGLQSSSEPVAYFGLGSAQSVELEVLWPDGQVSTFTDVAVDQAARVIRE